MFYRSRLGAAMAVAGTLAGCKPDRPSTATSTAAATPAETPRAVPATVTVTSKDYAFEAPASVPAGATTMRLVNHGKELHQAQLIKFEDGKTVKDFAEALKHPGPPPKWVKFMGGPNGVAPGWSLRQAVVTTQLRVRRRFIPSPDGVTHAAKGMIQPFEVTGASPASAELPAGDVTIKLVDYDFQLSPALTSGRHTITVENVGLQPHEVVLLKLAPGKKVEEFASWAESGMKGPPPADPVGGVTMLENGGSGSFTADLSAGNYGLICFVPDAKDGKPHLAHGMMKTITVN